MTDPKPDANEPEEAQEGAQGSFEENLARLEEIVGRLEEGNLPLDDSLKLYEEGIGAFRRCQKMLEDAELKVRKLVRTTEDGLGEEPFEPPEQ